MSFKEISPEQAWEMVQNGAMLADIRDPQRFTYSHAKGAFHLTNQSFLQFEELVDFDSPQLEENSSYSEYVGQPQNTVFCRGQGKGHHSTV